MDEYVCVINQNLTYRPVERIVRCRDCRRLFEERGELWCSGIVGPPVEPDGFCAWGEEKGNEWIR